MHRNLSTPTVASDSVYHTTQYNRALHCVMGDRYRAQYERMGWWIVHYLPDRRVKFNKDKQRLRLANVCPIEARKRSHTYFHVYQIKHIAPGWPRKQDASIGQISFSMKRRAWLDILVFLLHPSSSGSQEKESQRSYDSTLLQS